MSGFVCLEVLERERKKRRKRERKGGSARIKAIILLGAEFSLLS